MTPETTFGETHTWMSIAAGSDAGVAICRKCGLLKVQTPSGMHYFTQIGPPYKPCRYQVVVPIEQS
jgi:hypothetical protein